MPTLKDFGFTQEGGDGDDAKGSSRDFVLNPPNKHFGGEDEANKAFEAYFQDKKRVALVKFLSRFLRIYRFL